MFVTDTTVMATAKSVRCTYFVRETKWDGDHAPTYSLLFADEQNSDVLCGVFGLYDIAMHEWHVVLGKTARWKVSGRSFAGSNRDARGRDVRIPSLPLVATIRQGVSMSTFTFDDERAITQAIAAMKNNAVSDKPFPHYDISLNAEDLETVLCSLLIVAKDRNLVNEVGTGERASSLYSGILETLGVEVV